MGSTRDSQLSLPVPVKQKKYSTLTPESNSKERSNTQKIGDNKKRASLRAENILNIPKDRDALGGSVSSSMSNSNPDEDDAASD